MTRFWVASISKEHTMRGINGNFIQVCHGKKAPLKRMSKGDMILIYSSKITLDGNEKCQKFTAIGKMADDEIYSFQMSENFVPFRRKIKFYACEEYSILPLIAELDFIENKKMWGYPFRYGFFEINKKDYNLIASKMITNEK
ncbi:EVE domain-containing protein [Elizabethkingia miricola]|uniref:EVE domain-containing protein n=1 Tax=Elizabethkingia bruuniana TaxID=1756149 RepID=UPI0009999706|nr:EVE domain-containing protein [Elizabethkingia bruuniana]OPC66597.1 EVE domain-containing protein [Elizabethkingia bruuniana]RBI91466.1 EVE domain-containing protein [Elizabethkingia miricola]